MMDTIIHLANLRNQISSKQTGIYSLQQNVNTLYEQRNVCLSNIQRLEQELVDLLFYKKKLMKEFNHMEQLTSGDASPMGRIQFVKIGLLEGTALQSMQERIMERRQNQKNTLTIIDDSILHLREKGIEIEGDIEQEKKRLMNIDQSVASKQHQIHSLRAEISSIEGRVRTLT